MLAFGRRIADTGLMNEATENRISEKLVATVFHEDWWLNAVTQGTCEEVIVKNGIDIVGRLPFITNKQWD